MKPTTNCKKCGRPLTDPVSIAMGLGPECRGAGPVGRGKTMKAAGRKSSGKSYAQEVGSERANAIATGEPVTVGKDSRTKQPIIYTPDEQGNWVNTTTGHKMTDAALQAYLKKYGLLHTNSVQHSK